jgi:hypothetical protein
MELVPLHVRISRRRWKVTEWIPNCRNIGY